MAQKIVSKSRFVRGRISIWRRTDAIEEQDILDFLTIISTVCREERKVLIRELFPWGRPICMSLRFINRLRTFNGEIFKILYNLSHTHLLPSRTRPKMESSPPTEPGATPNEPPRKRRRKAAASNNRAGFVIPENRVAAQFKKTDWIFDGPYRRVPPY